MVSKSVNLIGIQPVVDIISLGMQSAFVSNEKNGASVILIGKPETAKTSCIFLFQNLQFVSYYDEITQKKLIDEFLPMTKKGEKRTLLIPDLINCTEKQKNTRDGFLNIIKTAIDDTGVMAINTPNKQLQMYNLIEGLKFNMITAITKGNYANIEKFMNSTGLASRFIPFTYDYPIDLIQKIMYNVEGRSIEFNVNVPEINQVRTEVKGDHELFREFEMIATKISMRYEGFGIRALINLIRLAKSNALLNHRNKVTEEDIQKVTSLSKWMNFDFNMVM